MSLSPQSCLRTPGRCLHVKHRAPEEEKLQRKSGWKCLGRYEKPGGTGTIRWGKDAPASVWERSDAINTLLTQQAGLRQHKQPRASGISPGTRGASGDSRAGNSFGHLLPSFPRGLSPVRSHVCHHGGTFCRSPSCSRDAHPSSLTHPLPLFYEIWGGFQHFPSPRRFASCFQAGGAARCLWGDQAPMSARDGEPHQHPRTTLRRMQKHLAHTCPLPSLPDSTCIPP